MNNIYDADYKRTIPPVIAENEDIKALSELVIQELKKINKEIEKNKIFSNIDNLDEKTLDIIAYDLNVLWYDYNYDLQTKRAVIKDCIKIYKKLGTPYAVKTALGNIFPETTLKEWHETNGDPYTFEIEINASSKGAPAELQKMALDRIKYYKNLRSHLSRITYILENKAIAYAGSAATMGNIIGIYPYTAENVIIKGILYAAASQGYKQEVKIYPYVSRDISYNRYIGYANCLILRREVIVQPKN